MATPELVLVVDDELSSAMCMELQLRLDGFAVEIVSDGQSALQRAVEDRPDLVLLDVSMPGMTGLEVCRRLRRDNRTKHASVILVSGRSLHDDRLAGFDAGADDYIVKPFDPDELVARARKLISRSKQLRGINPLTGLPGNVDITEDLSRRIAEDGEFALLYVDLDNFKPYNDAYGFVQGDIALRQLAHILVGVAAQHPAEDIFVGHVGGDDFVVLAPAALATELGQAIVSEWDRGVEKLFKPEDVARGGIQVLDRGGEVRLFPPTSVSIGIASNENGPLRTHVEVSDIAREMKELAKQQPGSLFMMDRRVRV